MKTSTKILILAIVLPSLALIAFYFIGKTNQCVPNCDSKKCGQSDGCSGKCKLCPTGEICDGKICNNVSTLVKNPKGICYFDIDGTLTTAPDDSAYKDEMMKQCLDNDFAIGIVTASPRTIDDICDGNKARVHWMSNLLCKQFRENGGKMYNSTTQVAGSFKFPPEYNPNASQGYVKGFDMKYGRDKFYSDIPDKCVVLFDDQQPVLDGVSDFNSKTNSNFQGQCANDPSNSNDNTTCTTLGHSLDIETVKATVGKMKANGCR
jgi:hypothetical protein